MTGPWGERPQGTPGDAPEPAPKPAAGSKPGGPRALNCPSCGAPIVVRAAGASVSVICGNCGSTLDATDPDLKLIHQSAAALARPAIPLGSRGVLMGTEWEVVGYLERSGDGGEWQEYLLFNPWEGYRFLVHGDNWRLGEALDRLPTEMGERAGLDGRTYDFQAHYEARVDFVVGEFYWRVAVGETVEASDFGEAWQGITLSREANGAEVGWTRLELLRDDVVASAFGLAPPDAPEPAAAGPSPYGRALRYSFIILGLALAGLLIAMIIGPWSRMVAQDTLIVEMQGPAVTRLIGPIAITRASSAVQVRTTTELENAWVELDYALVERRTQQRYEASATAEYYTGRDSDGNWSEGDKRPDVKFAGIPRGTYDLLVEARAQRWSGGVSGSTAPAAVTVSVFRDARFGSNLVLALLALAIWPAWLTWRWIRWLMHDGARRGL